MFKDSAYLGVDVVPTIVTGISRTAYYLVMLGDSLACLARDTVRPAKVSEKI